MFLHYYKLREQPFGVTPDPRYLYLSSTHREALASLVYGIEAQRGFMALVAQPGMGKTTLLFQLLRRLENSARTVFIFQTQCNSRDFLRSLLTDVGVEVVGGDLAGMQSKLNEVLLRESRAGRTVVVVVDEAQNLEPPVLEVLRMLSNFETPREKLMQIVLAGQPQFAKILMTPALLQLRQRVSILSRLEPFTPEETSRYIDHRLRAAGYDLAVPLFTRQARVMIAEYAEGIPRNINNVCFHALSVGCALKKRTVDREVINEVLDDLSLEPRKRALAQPPAISISHGSQPRTEDKPVEKPGEPVLKQALARCALAGLLLIATGLPISDPRRGDDRASSTNVPPETVATEPDHGSAATALTATRNPLDAPAGQPAADKSQSVSPSAEVKPRVTSSSPIPTGVQAIDLLPGQTISGICFENYGEFTTEILRQIFEVNPHLAHPECLQPGDVILIPAPADVSQTARSVGERLADASRSRVDEP
jgi:type II secretory pathway predicted ATPase ExeA/phage tail protein X